MKQGDGMKKNMKRLLNNLKGNKKGAIGIGAMIVFIAMVLVAGIAASVLIQTANRLEIQAMQTGQQTISEVATGLAVTDIEGHVTSSLIDKMTITVRARAGSSEIDLDEVVMEISDTTSKQVLIWGGASFYKDRARRTGVFNTKNVFAVGAKQFGIIELEDADNSTTSTGPVINRGDYIMITVNCTTCFSGLSPRDDVWGTIIPEEGASAVFAFRVPSSLSETVYDLY